MKSTQEIGQCKLCLENSHIIPSFAGNYLKATSATGYLRDAVKPNVRRQICIQTAPLQEERSII